MSARDELVFCILEDGLTRTTLDIIGECGDVFITDGRPDKEAAKRHIRAAGVLAKNKGWQLVFPVSGEDECWQILKTKGAPTLSRMRRLRKIEDGIRNARFEMAEFADRHTSDMDDAIRAIFRAGRAADAQLEEVRTKSSAALRRIEDEFVAMMRRKAEAEEWSAALLAENAELMARVAQLEAQLSGQ